MQTLGDPVQEIIAGREERGPMRLQGVQCAEEGDPRFDLVCLRGAQATRRRELIEEMDDEVKGVSCQEDIAKGAMATLEW